MSNQMVVKCNGCDREVRIDSDERRRTIGNYARYPQPAITDDPSWVAEFRGWISIAATAGINAMGEDVVVHADVQVCPACVELLPTTLRNAVLASYKRHEEAVACMREAHRRPIVGAALEEGDDVLVARNPYRLGA